MSLVLLEWQMRAGRNNNQGAKGKEIAQELYPEIKPSRNQENFMDGPNAKSERNLEKEEGRIIKL